MSDTETQYGGEKTAQEHPEKKVEITVDGKKREIRPGTYGLPEFKKIVHVDANRDLDQVINGEPTPIAGDVTIVGGEIFISHVPQGGSS